jgi:hypothetical protein
MPGLGWVENRLTKPRRQAECQESCEAFQNLWPAFRAGFALRRVGPTSGWKAYMSPMSQNEKTIFLAGAEIAAETDRVAASGIDGVCRSQGLLTEFTRLQLDHLPVPTAGGHQFCMGANLNDPALVHHHDLVGPDNRAQTMGDDK